MEVITSLAGRTRQPTAVAGQIRTGGFGQAAGLVNYLQTEQIDYLIDATHPFATQISVQAAAAAAICHIPHLMLVRPAWRAVPGDDWIEVETAAAAAATLPTLAKRVFLTIGQAYSDFIGLPGIWFLIRMIEPPQNLPSVNGKVILERGQFTLDGEQALLQQYQIGAVVTKNSGGAATYAKIAAARALKIPVVMIRRPGLPDGKQVPDVNAAMDWLLKQ